MPQFPSFKLTASSLILPFLLSSLAFAEEAAVPEKTVQTEVTSEFIFKYLAGEFAGQRGDLAIASRMFLELAQSTNDPRLAERATKAAVYGKDFITAIQAADLWAELDPASVEAQQATTQMLISIGRLDEAKQHLQKLLEKESTRANGFLYLNSLLARHSDKNAALNLVQALAQPYPELAEAHFSVAYAAWTAKQNDLAITELDAADQLRADWEMSALLRGQILYAQSPDATLAFFANFWSRPPKPTKYAPIMHVC